MASSCTSVVGDIDAGTAVRVHGFHADPCPVARSIGGCIPLTGGGRGVLCHTGDAEVRGDGTRREDEVVS